MTVIAARKLGEAAAAKPVSSLSTVLATRAALFAFMAGVYVISDELAGHLAAVGVFAAFFVIVGLTWTALATSSNVLVHRLTTGARRGSAVGAMNSVIGLAAFVGSLTGGAVASTLGYASDAVLSGALLVGAFLLSKKLILPE